MIHEASHGLQDPTISPLPDGRFIVGWENVGAGAATSLRAQIVDPRADPALWTGTGNNEQFGGTNFTAGDTLDGGAGDDALYGMGGNDRLIGASGGNDRFYGGAGIDTVSYLGASVGVAVYLAWPQDNSNAAAGDRYDSIEVIEGTIHRDTLEGSDRDETLKGGQGNDVITGGRGNNELVGEDGNDALYDVVGSNNLFRGGEGKDTVSYGNAVAGVRVFLQDVSQNRGSALGDQYFDIEVIDGSRYHDTLEGAAGNDAFWADEGNDRLYGHGGDDTLKGAGGNDVLDGGAGRDELHGDEGDDTYVVDRADAIVEAAGKGRDTLIANTSYVLAADADVEILHAGAEAGNISLTGNGINNTLHGNKDSNRLDGGAGTDTLMLTGSVSDYAVTLNQDGSITLTDKRANGDGSDTISNVEIFSFTDGKLSLAGVAAGAQRLLTSDVIDENSAAGTAIGSFIASAKAGGPLSYALIDDAEGRFTIDAVTGILKVANGVKLDYEQASQHTIAVQVTDASGASTIRNVTILVQDVFNERATGSPGADVMKGGAGQDHFTGLAGDDQIDAGLGNDTLIGGAGKDVLTGGKGKDIFVFDTKPNKKSNLDRITDFNVKDDGIWLENRVFTKLGKKGSEKKPAKLAKDFFTVGDKAKDANDYLIYNKKKGVLLYDADGSGSKKAVEVATLKKNLKMTEKDFFVI
ncbi:cadherin domain-containing protein [Microvirga splendida]|uniref:Cadherin domain-containing protein n=1 Tax=Microvirga splendida TaxID=2795727 RepID=A0ABS0XXM3_9HYPH|nr:cadherin domain-containing protein [Microvirga splendida]